MRKILGFLLLTVTITPMPAISQSTTTYTYDALGRLTSADSSGSVNNGVAVDYSYDPAGNRTTKAVTGVAPKVIVVPLHGLTVVPILPQPQ